jgi:hypothetical protein
MINKVSKKYYYFHPLTWYVLGYCVWMLIPPFFTESGHHFSTVTADLWAGIFLVIGYYTGVMQKRSVFGGYKIHFEEKNLKYFIIAIILTIYSVRMKLFSELGVYALLHPYSRESSLFDTVATLLGMPYVVLIMTLFYTTKKPIYIILFTTEVVLFLVPQMARSYYVVIPLFYFLIIFYYGNISKRRLIYRATPILIIALIFVSQVGPYINGVRSFAQIGEFDKGLELDYYSEDKPTSFIINRLNVHGEAFNFEPVIDEVVRMDLLAFQSMIEKWTGLESEYKIHPTTISNAAGILIGYGIGTSTDFPRNLVLANYPFPLLAIALFNFLLGMLMACIFLLIYQKRNRLFLMLWLLLIYAPMFGGGGAMPATFVFQYVFVLASLALLFVIYFFVKFTFEKMSEIWKLMTLRPPTIKSRPIDSAPNMVAKDVV